MEKKLEDKEIMRQFLDAIQTKPADFADELGYDSHTTIYRILNGKSKKISNEMIQRILAHYENASYLFLTQGKGAPLVEGKRVIAQRNVLPAFNDNPFAPYMEIPARLDEIQEAQAMINTKLDKLLSLLENK